MATAETITVERPAETLTEAPEPQLPAVPKAKLEAGADILGIIPRNLEEAWRLAGAFLDAGMEPSSYAKESGQRLPDKQIRARLMIGIMKSLEVGFPPITGLNTIAIINNRPSIYGAGAKALIQRSGTLEWMKEWFTGDEGSDDWTAHCEMKRIGQIEPYKASFSVKDAKRAKLWANPRKEPWMLYPKDMMLVRCFSRNADKGFADALHGLAIAEVIRDIDTPAPALPDTSFLSDGTATGSVNGTDTPVLPAPAVTNATDAPPPANDQTDIFGLPPIKEPEPLEREWQEYLDEELSKIDAIDNREELSEFQNNHADEWAAKPAPEQVMRAIYDRIEAQDRKIAAKKRK